MPKKDSQKKKVVIRPEPSKFRLVAKRSSAGLGLYTLDKIKKGRKIIQYGGYRITDEEAEKHYGKYLFDIIDTKYTIDGTPRWNLARYANHSCKPNAEAIWYATEVWICARKNILPGEEIVYDYGTEYFRDIIGGVKNCRCAKHHPARGHLGKLTEREMKKYSKRNV